MEGGLRRGPAASGGLEERQQPGVEGLDDQTPNTEEAAAFSLASGSSGNAIFLRSSGTRLLFDAGISAARIRRALHLRGERAEWLDGIFVSHEHSDHIAGLEVLARREGIPLFMTRGTYSSLCFKGKLRETVDYHVQFLEPGCPLRLGAVEVLPLSSPHDAQDPLCFRWSDGRSQVGIVTDLGHIPAHLTEAMAEVELLFLESNYDQSMLLAGPYSWPLKQRIDGPYGHLSNQAAADFACHLLERGCRRFVLAHLSATNNLPELAELTVGQQLRRRAAELGCDFRLELAPRHEPSEPFYLGQSYREEASS